VEFYLKTVSYGDSASRGVLVYVPALPGTYRAYPGHGGMARLSWPGWLVTCRDGLPALPTVSHPSTNRVRRWLTSSMRRQPRHQLSQIVSS